MVIQLDNSVVQCKFSSLTGGVLLPSPAAKAISQRSKAKTSNLSKDVITPEVHEDIRIGLQSIMSDLDDMLEGMKKKRSY